MGWRDAAIVLLVFVAIGPTIYGLDRLVGFKPPSLAECVADWNDRAASHVRSAVAGKFPFAAAQGWIAKESYPGCSIVFVGGPDQPWLPCIRTFRAAEARLTTWSCEHSGPPEGEQSRDSEIVPNTRVKADGTLILMGTENHT